jgi:hypothetical protein
MRSAGVAEVFGAAPDNATAVTLEGVNGESVTTTPRGNAYIATLQQPPRNIVVTWRDGSKSRL